MDAFQNFFIQMGILPSEKDSQEATFFKKYPEVTFDKQAKVAPAVAADLFEDLEIAPSGLLYDGPVKPSLFSRTSSSLSSSTTSPDGAGVLRSGAAAANPIATSSSTSETITSAAGVSSPSGSSSDPTATTSREAAIAAASTSYFLSFSPAAFLTNLFKSTLTVLGSTVVLGLLHFYLDDIYKRKYRFSLFESEILAYFAKKNILITGATSGIGECLAYRLASLENPPAVLYLHGRRREQLEKVAKQCILLQDETVRKLNPNILDQTSLQNRMKIEPILSDLGDPDQTFNAFKRAFKEPSAQETADLAQLLTVPQLANDPIFLQQYAACNPNELDIVFNNAGVSQRDEFSNLDVVPMKFILNTNCYSNILITKAVLPQLLLSGQKSKMQYEALAVMNPGVKHDPVAVVLRSCVKFFVKVGKMVVEKVEKAVGEIRAGVCATEETETLVSTTTTPPRSTPTLTASAFPHAAHIVQLSSFVGRVAFGYRTIYAASKFATNGFYTSLQAELFDKNIKIHTVFPGFVRTNIAKNALVSNGDSFGKSDAKIESGLDPMEVVNRMLAGVYFNDSEIEVLNDWHMRLQALSARWFGFLHRWFALSNYRKQVEMCSTASTGSTTSSTAAGGTLNLNNPAGDHNHAPESNKADNSSVASSARSSPSKTRRRKSIESTKFPPAIRVVPLNSPSVDSHSSFQNASHFTNTNNLHYGGGASSNSNSVEEVSNENLPKRVQKQQVEYYDLNNSGNLSYLSTEEETNTTSALNNMSSTKTAVEKQQKFVQQKNQTAAVHSPTTPSNTSPSASPHAPSGKSKGAKEGPSVETLHLHIEGKVQLTKEYLEGGNKAGEQQTQSKVEIDNFSKNSSTTGIDSENLEANPIETDAAAVSSSHEE
ncbi:unnamed protein product [Amoebophrya sp. A120]|nr:unnamed protein product [Amoebophrya sp. A120]|eukprot:GSA120T00013590001.1